MESPPVLNVFPRSTHPLISHIERVSGTLIALSDSAPLNRPIPGLMRTLEQLLQAYADQTVPVAAEKLEVIVDTLQDAIASENLSEKSREDIDAALEGAEETLRACLDRLALAVKGTYERLRANPDPFEQHRLVRLLECEMISRLESLEDDIDQLTDRVEEIDIEFDEFDLDNFDVEVAPGITTEVPTEISPPLEQPTLH